MRITLRQQAEPGCVFAGDTLDANIGRTIPVNLGAHRAEGVIVAARVVDDGEAMEVTVEVAEDEQVRHLESALKPPMGRYSIGATPPV